jgi:hypothetical protein
MLYPIRHSSHSLEEKSANFFRRHLPPEWNITYPSRDYGQDLSIEITEDGVYRGSELIVQLKASGQSNAQSGFERQSLKISTYNYLWENLRVAMLIKYIEAEDEAYWILLKDVDTPNQDNQTFTVYLPRVNTLSTINWDSIAGYVREITDIKLAASRVHARAVRQATN